MYRKLAQVVGFIYVFLLLISALAGCSTQIESALDNANKDSQVERPDSTKEEQGSGTKKDGDGFALIYPTSGSKNINPLNCIFRWEDIEGVQEYRLVIAEDEDFQTIVVDTTMGEARKLITDLKPETNYYWRVTASMKDKEGLSLGNKGGTWMFHTEIKSDQSKEKEQEGIVAEEGSDSETGVETSGQENSGKSAVGETSGMINRKARIQGIKDNWNLTFNDDFEGDKIDFTKWSYCPQWKRQGGYWSNKDSYVDGEGHLILRVSERDGKFYSGAVRSKDKFEQKQGYFEIRCQLQKEEGFWAAFWLMSPTQGNIGNEGRDGTEIDVMESAYLSSSKINHALHWDGYGIYHQSEGREVTIPGIYEGFHTFAVEWNENEYVFYVDDHETWRTSAGGVSQVPVYLKVTTEVGNWAGNIRNAVLPGYFTVDYVRVYQSPEAEE